ncbi:MAG: DUF1269 domain-containing protein [Gammaproteobacteria bacterium]|jgi:hypothetical protein
MKRRLYFILPDVKTARLVHNELLLAKIPETHMHVIAKEDSLLEDLPRANLLQKSDVIHAIQTGLPIGGVVGIVMGALAIAAEWVSPGYEGVVLMATVLAGVVIGTWSSTMIAVDVPNSRHKAFEQDIDKGKLLYIVDVPVLKVDEVTALVVSHHPNADVRGIEPNIPVFP